MRTPRFPRAVDTIGARRPRAAANEGAHARPAAKRSYESIGVGRSVVSDVLGDLAEERALRSTQDGPLAASAWYARELLRSAPHMALDAMRRALQTSRGRMLVFGSAATVVTLIAALAGVIATRNVPAQLALGSADTVVVNNVRTTRIPVHVLDDAGRTIDDDARGARFERVSADTGIAITSNGDVTCGREGFARVHVERGSLSRAVVVQCAPVREFFVDGMLRFLTARGPVEPIRMRAIAPDSSAVTRIAGSITVRDSDIVAIKGSRLVPRNVGSTELQITVGDETELQTVTVRPAAASPSDMGIGELFSKDLSLAPGSALRWRVHQGLYTIWLRRPADRAASPLHLMLQELNCVASGPDQQFFCVALAGATLTVVAPASRDAHSPLESRLIVERSENYPGEGRSGADQR